MATTSVMHTVLVPVKQDQQEIFFQDVIRGLSAKNKYLDSKYFYDAEGDRLFQEIMGCHEYYPTNCEMEILQEQSALICETILAHTNRFDVVELGAGDATKSIHLLRELLNTGKDFTYYPVDISGNVISQLEQSLPAQLPALKVHGLHGEYFDMLQKANVLSAKNKVILCMGGNIGNFTPPEARKFCRRLRSYLQPGDLLMIGFDLKKHPQIILDAYNDAAGITRSFNLNLLHRINRELGANFDIARFDHYATYDPGTGACKSYLVSLEEQDVTIGSQTFHFGLHESIYMEISQKYDLESAEQLGTQSGFETVGNFFDKKKWFVDTMWLSI
ncbi:L-histidine N(alpha)-methyltransferase [Chitinophaga rhizophila]|uniref:L-histidine N(Alpha)-methyltransferase n=1 Tax=Chitinophaga rhizophila TaxID=2866212 RepID=A0ABS7GIE7_9BACT|nr:L-histidine N(alpha)-methyltransferase [Chitinophaga rhizophila]MBW8687462.1 L-histidine N(alpha)-methyltransferase [Chitinophaga rhizophila]